MGGRIVRPEGHVALLEELPDAFEQAQQRLPDMLMQSLREQLARVKDLQADIARIEHRLFEQLRATPACQTIAEIPGVGLLTATAVVATMGSPATRAPAVQRGGRRRGQQAGAHRLGCSEPQQTLASQHLARSLNASASRS